MVDATDRDAGLDRLTSKALEELKAFLEISADEAHAERVPARLTQSIEMKHALHPRRPG
jgi:hypothetical protein